MPDFRVEATAQTLVKPVWDDPASITLPSRITGVNKQQHRKIVVIPNEDVLISAIMDGETVPEDDLTVGLFTMWALEYPADNGPPSQLVVTPGVSAVQEFILREVGHYTIGVRHEDYGGAPKSAAGGVVVIHLDVEDPTPP